MKAARVVMLVLTGIVMVSLAGCCGSETPTTVSKPTVGSVPQGWYLSDETAYGTFEDTDGTIWGLLEYTDPEDYDFVQIWYGHIPPELKGKESDGSALVARAVIEAVTFEPEETGTMTVSGRTAGYAETCDPEWEWCEKEIVWVEQTTYFDVYAMYDDTSADWNEVVSLIQSIDP